MKEESGFNLIYTSQKLITKMYFSDLIPYIFGSGRNRNAFVTCDISFTF